MLYVLHSFSFFVGGQFEFEYVKKHQYVDGKMHDMKENFSVWIYLIEVERFVAQYLMI